MVSERTYGPYGAQGCGEEWYGPSGTQALPTHHFAPSLSLAHSLLPYSSYHRLIFPFPFVHHQPHDWKVAKRWKIEL